MGCICICGGEACIDEATRAFRRLCQLQEVADLERNLLMEELATVVTHGRGSPATVQEAKQWTLLQWTTELFPVRSPRWGVGSGWLDFCMFGVLMTASRSSMDCHSL